MWKLIGIVFVACVLERAVHLLAGRPELASSDRFLLYLECAFVASGIVHSWIAAGRKS